MSGRKTSSEMAVGLILARQRRAPRSRSGDQDLESLIAREIAQHARVVRIVFDDQQHGVAVFDRFARSSSMRDLLLDRRRRS